MGYTGGWGHHGVGHGRNWVTFYIKSVGEDITVVLSDRHIYTEVTVPKDRIGLWLMLVVGQDWRFRAEDTHSASQTRCLIRPMIGDVWLTLN